MHVLPPAILSLTILCQFNAPVIGDDSDVVYPCYNGRLTRDNVCKCDDEYAGRMCERRMHCRGFRRNDNATCDECTTGWTGAHCDLIDCGENGDRDETGAECVCHKPYSGSHCERLRTADVYSHYNRMMMRYSPLIVLIVVPLIFVFMICRKFGDEFENLYYSQ